MKALIGNKNFNLPVSPTFLAEHSSMITAMFEWTVSESSWLCVEKWRVKSGVAVQLDAPIGRVRVAPSPTSPNRSVPLLSPVNGFLRCIHAQENEPLHIWFAFYLLLF